MTTPVQTCSQLAMGVWDHIKADPFSATGRALLACVEQAHPASYWQILGFLFEVAVYQVSELPCEHNPQEAHLFVITLPADRPEEEFSTVNMLFQTADQAWHHAAQALKLQDRYEACARQSEGAGG